VADVTSEPDRPRGGVDFEARFAFGLNIPVIWSCREDLAGQLHFDIRQFNHIVWAPPDDLYHKLKNRIGAVWGWAQPVHDEEDLADRAIDDQVARTMPMTPKKANSDSCPPRQGFLASQALANPLEANGKVGRAQQRKLLCLRPLSA
jgi:hypothetical protein